MTIVDERYVSLAEAGKLMQLTEKDVFKLTIYGFLEVSSRPTRGGDTMVSLRSIETYALRNGIALQKAPKPSVGRSGILTVQQAMTKLGFNNERSLHLLIQSGKLKAHNEGGEYVVDAQSLHDYVTGRC